MLQLRLNQDFGDQMSRLEKVGDDELSTSRIIFCVLRRSATLHCQIVLPKKEEREQVRKFAIKNVTPGLISVSDIRGRDLPSLIFNGWKNTTKLLKKMRGNKTTRVVNEAKNEAFIGWRAPTFGLIKKTNRKTRNLRIWS